MTNINTNDLSRLRWKCRRGMLELDVLLERFVDHGYQALTEAEQQQFHALLDLPDPVLWAYLAGHEQPLPEFDAICGLVLSHQR